MTEQGSLVCELYRRKACCVRKIFLVVKFNFFHANLIFQSLNTRIVDFFRQQLQLLSLKLLRVYISQSDLHVQEFFVVLGSIENELVLPF